MHRKLESEHGCSSEEREAAKCGKGKVVAYGKGALEGGAAREVLLMTCCQICCIPHHIIHNSESVMINDGREVSLAGFSVIVLFHHR